MASQAQEVAGTRTPVTVGNALLLGGATVLTVLLETVARASVRLPGHRAFPGALAILLFAGMFRPWMLLAFGLSVPVVLVMLGAGHGWMLLATWLAAAGAAAWAARARRPGVVACLCVGALFGLLRWASLLGGVHHTPQLVRFSGHVMFGLLGGALAWAASRGGAR